MNYNLIKKIFQPMQVPLELEDEYVKKFFTIDGRDI